MNPMMIITLIILILSGLTCANVGTFVVLKNQAMITDALSHTVLLGIVLTFLVVPDIDSPLLQVGAAFMGVITVYLIEWLIKKTTIQNDAAIGLIFTFLFSIAIIILSKFMRNVHLDLDCVIMGDVIFSSFKTQEILGITVPKSIISTSALLIVATIFIFVFWEELKISIFDPEFAKTVGIKRYIVDFSLMFLVSLTTVINFSIVGSILVISFFVAPTMTAKLFTNQLKTVYELSLFISIVNSVIGFFLATIFNVSIAGMCATVAFFNFIASFLIERKLKQKQLIA